jgi:hypothetical protein
MKRNGMETAIFWLVIMGPLIIGIAACIYYGGSKTFAVWVGFVGCILLLLAATFQWQQIILKSRSSDIPVAVALDQRPWVTVDIKPAGPITWNHGGFQVSYKITLKTALDPASDGNIPVERVRIRRHPQVDGHVD